MCDFDSRRKLAQSPWRGLGNVCVQEDLHFRPFRLGLVLPAACIPTRHAARLPGPARPAGMPPAIDWKNSENLGSTTLLYPAPHRYVLSGMEAFGYKNDVLFPIRVTLKEPVSSAKRFDILALGQTDALIFKVLAIVIDELQPHLIPFANAHEVGVSLHGILECRVQ